MNVGELPDGYYVGHTQVRRPMRLTPADDYHDAMHMAQAGANEKAYTHFVLEKRGDSVTMHEPDSWKCWRCGTVLPRE